MHKFIFLFIAFFMIDVNLFPVEILIYKKPVELTIFKPDDYKNESVIYPKFYPIGWSLDGKFGFIDMISGGGRSNFLYRFYIIDLVEDKVLSGIEIESNDNESFDVIWKEYYAQFKNALNEFKISNQNRINLLKFPINRINDKISFTIDKKITGQDMWTRDTGSLNININSTVYGNKIIYKNENDNLSESVEGYLKSPYEERIAVLISTSIPGWEGPPDEVWFKVIGCHLTKGFVKK